MNDLFKIVILCSFLFDNAFFGLEACELFHTADENIGESLIKTENFSIENNKEPKKSQENFNLIIEQIADLYRGTINDLGGNLKLEKKWEDSTFNATAGKDGHTWALTFYGGLYRYPDLTQDAFALVACHEMGHLLGGAPYVVNSAGIFSIEGQADYWAASVCLKEYFSKYPKTVSMQEISAKIKCDEQYDDFKEKNICYRIALAGFSLTNSFATMDGRNIPTWHGGDDSERLSYTMGKHPKDQCRLDTYLAGATCEVQDHTDNFEKILMQNKMTTDYLCKDNITGKWIDKRPSCWFNPQINGVGFTHKYTIFHKALLKIKVGKISIKASTHFPGKYTLVVERKPRNFTANYFDIYPRMSGSDYVDMKIEAGHTIKDITSMLEFDLEYGLIIINKENIDLDLVIQRDSKEVYRKTITIDSQNTELGHVEIGENP